MLLATIHNNKLAPVKANDASSQKAAVIRLVA